MSGYVESLLGANEKVLVRERQHWFIWIPQLILSLLLIIVITAASLLLGVATTTAGSNGIGLIALVLNVIPIWMFARVFLKWRNEEYIVTNRRILQSEGMINKSVIDSSLEKINDVVLSQSVMGRIMDFGDLEILTSSELGINKLHRIKSPVQFKIAMLNAKEAMRDMNDVDDHTPSLRPRTQRDIPELIAELDDLRKKGLITEAEFQEKRAKLMNQI